MTTSPLGRPLLGALLRIPVDVIRARMIDALHEQGFTDLIPAHLIVLRYPGPDGRRPIEIAAQSGMSKQALNYQLGQLETLGYLQRLHDPEDHRSKRVHLTERGHAAMQTVRAAVSEVEAEWARELGAEDLEELRALLSRLAIVVAR
jgi:DNA-binding MarR family transcriptional regulator